MARLRTILEDEAKDALEIAGEASTRHCPECKKRTPHAFVVQITQGSVAQGWQCLTCGHLHN